MAWPVRRENVAANTGVGGNQVVGQDIRGDYRRLVPEGQVNEKHLVHAPPPAAVGNNPSIFEMTIHEDIHVPKEARQVPDVGVT
jgi:hypothetical protein